MSEKSFMSVNEQQRSKSVYAYMQSSHRQRFLLEAGTLQAQRKSWSSFSGYIL